MNGRAGIALIALKELELEMHNRLEVPGLSDGGASRRERASRSFRLVRQC
jgi:hypothetical protein